jgi:hypothetical protein
VAIGLASHCPYGLGARCPLVEALARTVKIRKRLMIVSKIAAVLAGTIVTAAAVAAVYY